MQLNSQLATQRDRDRVVTKTMADAAKMVLDKALEGKPAAAEALGRALDGAQAHMVPGAEFQDQQQF